MHGAQNFQFWKNFAGTCKRFWSDLFCCGRTCGIPIPCYPYPQDGIGSQIDQRFGANATLKDLENSDCIAAAVAKVGLVYSSVFYTLITLHTLS